MSHGPALAEPPHADPPAYLAALRAFLAPLEGTAFHDRAWYDRTDIARFGPYFDILEAFRPVAGAVLLDLGMGTGGFLLAARRWGVARAIGVELDRATFGLAALRLAGSGCEALRADGAALPLSAGLADIAVSLHVLEHTTDPAAYLAETARVLVPGGLLLLGCPNRLVPREVHGDLPWLPWLPAALARAYARRRAADPRLPLAVRRQFHTATQVNHFLSYFGLRRLWRAAGFEPLVVNYSPRFGVPASDLGAWGAEHPALRLPWAALNNGLLHGLLGPLVRGRQPVQPWAAVSLLLNWEHLVLLRKGGGR